MLSYLQCALQNSEGQTRLQWYQRPSRALPWPAESFACLSRLDAIASFVGLLLLVLPLERPSDQWNRLVSWQEEHFLECMMSVTTLYCE